VTGSAGPDAQDAPVDGSGNREARRKAAKQQRKH
jgi:hypothetical protein